MRYLVVLLQHHLWILLALAALGVLPWVYLVCWCCSSKRVWLAHNDRICFGRKHRNIRFQDVFDADEPFVVWVLGLAAGSAPGLGSFQRYCAHRTGLRTLGPQERKTRQEGGGCYYFLGFLVLVLAFGTWVVSEMTKDAHAAD